jgi:hypothetical protein
MMFTEETATDDRWHYSVRQTAPLGKATRAGVRGLSDLDDVECAPISS